MGYCPKCGNEIVVKISVCPNCGYDLRPVRSSTPRQDEQAGCLLKILVFLWPLIGLILYIFWRHDYPRKSSSLVAPAIIGFIVDIIFIMWLF